MSVVFTQLFVAEQVRGSDAVVREPAGGKAAVARKANDELALCLDAPGSSSSAGQSDVPPCAISIMKARQAAKMREIRDALEAEGCTRLDQQAKILGLSRSTAWTVLMGSHKSSGLSANVIRRMLSAPRLHASVRGKILEYVQEKASGQYGGNTARLRQFLRRVDGS
jgi:hypothetical protein